MSKKSTTLIVFLVLIVLASLFDAFIFWSTWNLLSENLTVISLPAIKYSEWIIITFAASVIMAGRQSKKTYTDLEDLEMWAEVLTAFVNKLLALVILWIVTLIV